MEYATLGRTGLRVSVAGLGCGGFSRPGLGTGKSEEEAVALVRQALDLRVNLLDTVAVYGTEGVVGQAIKSVPRDSVVIATKAWIPRREDRSAAEGKLRYLGVTETGSSDPEHSMVRRAVEDGMWDVVVVAFHMMRQNA